MADVCHAGEMRSHQQVRQDKTVERAAVYVLFSDMPFSDGSNLAAKR